MNSRTDGSHATLTGKRETENYLHVDAIEQVLGVRVAFGETDHVPEIVARAVHETDPSSNPWDGLDEEKRQKKISRVKRRLNEEVAAKMTVEHIAATDPQRDIENWLREIGSRLGDSTP